MLGDSLVNEVCSVWSTQRQNSFKVKVSQLCCTTVDTELATCQSKLFNKETVSQHVYKMEGRVTGTLFP